MNEQEKYNIIKTLSEKGGNKKNAALKIGCTTRHVNRMLKGYMEFGKDYLSHKNKNRKPDSALDDDLKQNIILLYSNKYFDANFRHFTELLALNEDIHISEGTIRNILLKNDILSPKAWKRTRKALAKRLRTKHKSAKSVKVKESLQAAIDDATGMIVGAYFDHQETLNGYYQVFKQILQNYGIPYMFYTDRRTVFEYKKKNSLDTEKDTFTQFSYACKQLGVDLKVSSIPQAKGRIECLFSTLQSRLPVDMRLAGIKTIEQSNEFLNPYIKKFNAQFALPLNTTTSVFEV